MVHLQDTYTPGTVREKDWSSEIVPAPARSGGVPGTVMPDRVGPELAAPARTPQVLDMRNGLSAEAIQAPTTVEEAHMGSWKALLSRNQGNYVVATFLVGTQNTISWEGILYDVGNDYLTIYQESRDRYIVSDYYSLKFIEFYDVERRRLCARLLRENGLSAGGMGEELGGRIRR